MKDPVDEPDPVYQRYAQVDDEAYGYTTVDLHLESDEQQDRDSWQRRIALSAADLAIVPAATRELIPLLVGWCTQVDPARRPSMEIVLSVLRHAVTGEAVCDWTAFADTIVSARLAEVHWTEGDGRLLAALCRQRGRPVVVAHGGLSNGRVSAGGARLLGGLMQEQQVCVFSIRVVQPCSMLLLRHYTGC